jgi:hypothetical protein
MTNDLRPEPISMLATPFHPNKDKSTPLETTAYAPSNTFCIGDALTPLLFEALKNAVLPSTLIDPASETLIEPASETLMDPLSTNMVPPLFIFIVELFFNSTCDDAAFMVIAEGPVAIA